MNNPPPEVSCPGHFLFELRKKNWHGGKNLCLVLCDSVNSLSAQTTYTDTTYPASMAPQSNLYREALAKFREEKEGKYQDAKDRQTLYEFLAEKGTPEDAQRQALTLKDDAGKKYGSRKVGDTEIPQAWINNILGNISNFIKIGDYATTGAPESVGLAWYAVRLTLSAIQNNYDLYNFFGAGLSDISEIMIIIPHYDRLYDERNRQASWKPSALVEKLFGEIKHAYIAVLDFSLSIMRHLKGGFKDKLRHGFKDFFGLQKDKFKQKLDTIAHLKQKILADCEAAFQGRALEGIDGMRDVVGGIESTVAQIQAFQPELERMHKEQLNKLDELEKHFAKFDEKLDGMHEDIKAWAKPKTPWEMAVQEFTKNKGSLKPMVDTSDEFLALASGEGRLEGTFEWVFEGYYIRWQQQIAGLLCVTGREGKAESPADSRPVHADTSSAHRNRQVDTHVGHRQQIQGRSDRATPPLHILHRHIRRGGHHGRWGGWPECW